jgi:hypothetical protein
VIAAPVDADVKVNEPARPFVVATFTYVIESLPNAFTPFRITPVNVYTVPKVNGVVGVRSSVVLYPANVAPADVYAGVEPEFTAVTASGAAEAGEVTGYDHE